MKFKLLTLLLISFTLTLGFSDEKKALETEAVNYLISTEIFANSYTGPRISFEGNAYSVVNNSENKNDLFKEIYEKGKTAGKIYALIGLFNEDADFVKKEIKVLMSKKLQVKVQDSCCIKASPADAVLKNEHPRAVRLTDSSPTIKEWFSNNPGDGAYPDVFGGSYSEIFGRLKYDSKVVFNDIALKRTKPLVVR